MSSSNTIELIIAAFNGLDNASKEVVFKQLCAIYGGVPASSTDMAQAVSTDGKKKRAAKTYTPEEKAARDDAAAKRKHLQDELVSSLLDDFKSRTTIPIADFTAKVKEYDDSLDGKQFNIVFQKFLSAKLGISYSAALPIASEWKKGNFVTAPLNDKKAAAAAEAAPAPAAEAPATKKPAPKKAAAKKTAAAPAPEPAAPEPAAIYFEVNGKKYIRVLPENYAYSIDAEGNPSEPAGYWDPVISKFDTTRPAPADIMFA